MGALRWHNFLEGALECRSRFVGFEFARLFLEAFRLCFVVLFPLGFSHERSLAD